ncbi:hypothetical protein HYALB_00004101 [Hymenoscyphus albidus]|uniref:Zinc finger Mcm10/DnaG-type domain-containing protein n=1 Tax=Hymenoscyphus albidus TaxID=595503 RepID=A0A9N9QD03_9HELO|nr:hypothetical protein HYALB_00004101 [Hymenoscyphus albidus]
MSQDDNPEWPPRSPHAALMSTPGGRDRLRRLAQRASPSPSPIKPSKSSASLRHEARGMMDGADDSDGEEDEETLNLKLEEIQLKIKIKEAQRRKQQTSDNENESKAGTSRAGSVAASRAQSRLEGIRERQLQRSKSQTNINVPVSPVRRTFQAPTSPKSPKRVLLGIDKGLTGRDISLKRAPSLRKREENEGTERRLGPFLQRPQSQIGTNGGSFSSINSSQESRQKSFSERMAAARTQDTERQDREARMRKNRSTAFDINQEQMQSYKESAVEMPEAPRRPSDFSREDILKSVGKPTASSMARSRTTPALRLAMKESSLLDSSTVSSSRSDSRASSAVPPSRNTKSKITPSDVSETEASQFEPFSATHLSKRIIPHHALTRTLSGKKTFLVPDLLRTVKGPDFSAPDIEEDLVVFAIIAKKTDPRSHVPNGKSEKRGKYMIMGLTDLKWELDLALFDSAFDKFWKLTPGTLIAILNPGFMPPPRGRADTGKFSLVLNSDADTVLEIGNARDLGFCKSVKKDGKTCDSWIDKRHTEFCDFHVNLTLQKTRASRMEVNTMNFGRGDYGAKKFNSKDMTGYMDSRKNEKTRKNVEYDRESHSTVFIGKRTTANLLDDVDYDPDHFQRGSNKEERLTRQLIAQEKERELERKLGEFGNGMGADYMRAKQPSRAGSRTDTNFRASDQGPPPPPDAAKLGLLGGKAMDIRLSPIKRKRANTTSSKTARGWGSDLSKDLGRMKEGEALQPKKKTRFVTAKGIREAGRESIPTGAVLNDFHDDDDSDLDIVRE